MSHELLWLLIVVMLIFYIFGSYLMRWRLLRYIHIIALFFSIGFVSTILCAIFARASGAYDSHGIPVGLIGQSLDFVRAASTDYRSEIFIIIFSMAAILLPQVMAYFICGLFGLAGNIFFANRLFHFSFWSLFKTCLIGAGLSIAMIPSSFIIRDPKAAADIGLHCFMAVFLIGQSTVLFFIYIASDYNIIPSFIPALAAHIHEWATRKL